MCGLVSAGTTPFEAPWLFAAGILLTGPLVCGASQIINDWHDREVDALNEPHRPIPSGRVSEKAALRFAFCWCLLAQAWSFTLWRLGCQCNCAGFSARLGVQRTTPAA
jgi:chlorophyll synthase